MKTGLLAASAAVALIVSGAATASAESTENRTTVQSVEQSLERGWENTKETVKEMGRDAKAAVHDLTRSDEPAFRQVAQNGTETMIVGETTIDMDDTVSGMIGKSIYSPERKQIATVEDLILTHDGSVSSVIVANGGFLGIGEKLVALDYNTVTAAQPHQGNAIATIPAATLDQAMAFSYDGIRPAGGTDRMSANDLIGASLVNTEGQTVGKIDNIALANGKAEHLIVSFNDVLGVGGKKVAMRFSGAPVVWTDGKASFQLSASQAALFEEFKGTMTR